MATEIKWLCSVLSSACSAVTQSGTRDNAYQLQRRFASTAQYLSWSDGSSSRRVVFSSMSAASGSWRRSDMMLHSLHNDEIPQMTQSHRFNIEIKSPKKALHMHSQGQSESNPLSSWRS